MIKLRLSEVLSELKFTQKDLSNMTGIRQATISAYCNNDFKHIVTSHLDKICYVLQCKPSDIIEYTWSKPTDLNQEQIKLIYDFRPFYNIKNDVGNCDQLEFIIHEKNVNMLRQTKDDIIIDSDNGEPTILNKQEFYDYINNNIGKLSIDDMQNYVLLLCSQNKKMDYNATLRMITDINNQHKKL